MTTEPEKAGREQAGRFEKGRSGNPAGKPRGARHRATLAAEALLDGEAEALTRKAIEKAKEGDSVALRLCLERILPARRDRAVSLELPKIETASDVLKAISAILAALAAGELTPTEAGDVVKIVEAFSKAVAVSDLEGRIAALEKKGVDQ
jgi:hypothetical protein